jgi:fatty acid synthase subunit alpha
VVHLEGASPIGIEVFGTIRSRGTQDENFKAVEVEYTPDTKAIDITIFEERRGISVPLHMKFNYVPSLGSIPIHEIEDGRSMRIKDFYWRL